MWEIIYLYIVFRGFITLSKSVLKVSFSTLISHTISRKNRDPSVCEKLPNYHTMHLVYSPLVLTAGGSPNVTVLNSVNLKHYKIVIDIYIFNPHINQWVKVADFSEAKCCFGCIVMSSSKLLIYSQWRNWSHYKSIYCAHH